jgi:hypothetical protein
VLWRNIALQDARTPPRRALPVPSSAALKRSHVLAAQSDPAESDWEISGRLAAEVPGV